jgi:hypothetical protein
MAMKNRKPYPGYRDLERVYGIPWVEIIELEPRVADLLHEARRACGACQRWSDVTPRFAPFRNALAALVGFTGAHRRHPVLGTVGAYEVGYWRLYDAIAGLLPPPDAADWDAISGAGAGAETLSEPVAAR